MKKIIFFLSLLLSLHQLSAGEGPAVILFMIDGLHWEAPARLNMPVLNQLIKEGTYIPKSYMIVPHHPTVGSYGELHSCSFPNPVLHTGTLFIRSGNRMLQEQINPLGPTGFVVNTPAYRSVARGFTTCIQDVSLSDAQVVQQAILLLDNRPFRFMRIHLQHSGDQGVMVAMNSEGKPWACNIWAEGSPYVEAVEQADRLLGQLIDFLKKSGRWEETVLIVTSDHGQSSVGWHPMLDEDSWMTPLVFAGKGIARGRKLDYFEHTDLAPTIAWICGAEPPNCDGGSGQVVRAVSATQPADAVKSEPCIRTINRQIREYNLLHAELVLASREDKRLANLLASLSNQNLTPEPFYDPDRITDWYKAGSTANLIKANQKIIDKMKEMLKNTQP